MERIPEQFSEPAVGTCIEWTGRRTIGGYGRTMHQGRERPAHQVAWELANGRGVPEGMVIMHRCDNPGCVNAEHLQLGTHADNQKDKAAKGRAARGAGNGRAKLDAEKVRQIRRMAADGRSPSGVAAVFGVDPSAVRAILAGRTWKDVA